MTTARDNQLIAAIINPASSPQDRELIHQLAEQLNIPVVDGELQCQEFCHLLEFSQGCLTLRPVGRSSKVGGPVYCDLLAVNTQAGPGASLKQPLAKAVGLHQAKKRGDDLQQKPLHIIDATAGLGEDTWLLAALGCTVTAVERQPVIAALFNDGLNRAAETQPLIAGRIKLVHADAIDWLQQNAGHADFDVVYIDPMFPAKHKAALQRKEMRLLRDIVGTDDDASQLLDTAIRSTVGRIVVKRPNHAPLLGQNPVAIHKGKSLRYEVYRGLA